MLCLVGLICPVYAETGVDLQPTNSNGSNTRVGIVMACFQYGTNVNNMVRANADFFEALKKVTPNATSEERQIILQMLSSVQKAMGAEGNVIDLCSKYTTKK